MGLGKKIEADKPPAPEPKRPSPFSRDGKILVGKDGKLETNIAPPPLPTPDVVVWLLINEDERFPRAQWGTW